MAITTKESDLMQAIAASRLIDSWKVGGDGDRVLFDVTQDTEVGDAGSKFRLYRTQQGSVALLLGTSLFKPVGFTYPVAFNMGHEAYTMPDGTIVAEDQTAFATNIALTANVVASIGALADIASPFTSLLAGGVTICLWETGAQAIPIDARLEGSLAFNQA